MKKFDTKISEELLIAYIEGNCDIEKRKEIEALLEKDNLVFLTYSRLKNPTMKFI